MNKFYVKVNGNVAVAEVLIELARKKMEKEKGEKYCGDGFLNKSSLGHKKTYIHNEMGFDLSIYWITHSEEDNFYEKNGFTLVSLEKAIEILSDCAPTEIQVQLNGDCAAIVSRRGIKIGCQTFPITIIKDLADALEKVKKN